MNLLTSGAIILARALANILYKRFIKVIGLQFLTSVLSPVFGRSLMTPLLFVIAADAMFYVLRASELGPPVKGISLPNMDELINVQFVDDTSLFLGLTEENFDNAIRRLDFFCKVSGSKIAPAKSTILGWQQDSPDWLVSKGWN